MMENRTKLKNINKKIAFIEECYANVYNHKLYTSLQEAKKKLYFLEIYYCNKPQGE